jgi:hypothetical protein
MNIQSEFSSGFTLDPRLPAPLNCSGSLVRKVAESVQADLVGINYVGKMATQGLRPNPVAGARLNKVRSLGIANQSWCYGRR